VPRPTPPRDTAGAPQTGTATIRGRVLAQDGSPLRRAQVSVLAEGAPLRRGTTTDGDGKYEFLELPAGRFTVSAVKTGYVTLQYGQRRPLEAGTPLSIADGQTVERIDFTLPKGSVISVRVTDEFGEPLAGVQVQVQRFQYGPDGQRRLVQASSGLSPFAATDDRGEFRAFGLMPGDYVVVGSLRSVLGGGPPGNANDGGEGFSPTYYPGTISSAEAQAVSIGVGQETAVQFAMVASRLSRVSGRVVDSQGRPAAGAQISLVTTTGNGSTSSSVGSVAADGSFTVGGVSPGEHTLRIQQGRPGVPGEGASFPIVVAGSDLQGVLITTGAGATVTGRVVWEGTSPRTTTSAPLSLRVTAQQADAQRQLAMLGGFSNPLENGTLDDDGNFTLAGVTGRVFFSVQGAAPPWTVKSVSLDGEDIRDVPLDVTGRTTVADLRVVLTDKQTNISGQVMDARGQPLKDYVVVIQAAEQKEPVIASRWIRVVRPDNNGRFETRGMRPGRYLATAIEALEQGRQFSPEFQKELRPGAREFSVREGESVTVDLRLTIGL
jgi:protocatechuate 3,4-dioxygenase beta subunit